MEPYLKTLTKFLLLLVNDAETEVNLVRLLEIGLHPHHLRESFFRMFQ